jgi:hypothetical protein
VCLRSFAFLDAQKASPHKRASDAAPADKFDLRPLREQGGDGGELDMHAMSDEVDASKKLVRPRPHVVQVCLT